MAKPWEKYSGAPAAAAAASKPWEKYGGSGEMPMLAPPPVSPVESAARGAAQGASLGFADEAAGGLDYLKQALGQISKGGMLTNSDALGSAYTGGRDESRANYDAAQKANPSTYLAGQLAGSLAVPAGPAGIAQTAALGGVQALGNSEANTASGLAADTALGAGLGGVVGGVSSLAGKGLSKLGDLASDATEGTGGLLREGAESLANRATNSSSGREALDSGVLKLGDNAQKAASRLGEGASPDLVQGLGERAAREAKEGFFSDADKLALGGSIFGGPQGLASVGSGIVGKNLAATRGAATSAVALDNIGEVLQKTPQMLGKFAKPLQDAQARGALSPTLFVLQQTNPEFRKLVYGGEEN